MSLPAGLLPKMSICLNYFDALTGYQRAAAKNATVNWFQQAGGAAEIVAWALEQRRNNWGEDGDSTE
jgi:hypothetical protein